MAGFLRRFSDIPDLATLRAIEGVAILDLPPPGSVQAVGVGTVALLGEFVDMTFAAFVDTAGAVTRRVRPQEVFGTKDLIDKFGGFDELLGQFGGAMGNGFVSLRNKKFSRLVVAPVNLASAVRRRRSRISVVMSCFGGEWCLGTRTFILVRRARSTPACSLPL